MSEDGSRAPARWRSAAGLKHGLRLSGAVLCVLVILLEVVPRVLPIPYLRERELDPLSFQLAQARVGPHPYLAYANKPDYDLRTERQQIHHNALGFRGPETTWAKPQGTYRVVCLGGSSTYGFGPSSDATTWPARLEARLNETAPARKVEVINAGCQGYSTFESLINLSIRCVDFAPDLVVVYHTINDMRCALYPGVRHDNAHWRANWPVASKLPLETALESSYTYLAWRRYLTNWWSERQNLGSWVIVDFGKYRALSGDDFAQPTDPTLGYANFQRNLVSIAAVARAHGSDALFATQAVRMSDIEKPEVKSGALQHEAFDQLTRIIGNVCNERSIPYCDTRIPLEAAAGEQARASGVDGIFTNEVHLTDAGADLLASVLAARILELGLLK